MKTTTFFHVKKRKPEPEGVHGHLEGCNRNLRSKAAVANVFPDKDVPFIQFMQITPTHNIKLIVIFVSFPRRRACKVKCIHIL